VTAPDKARTGTALQAIHFADDASRRPGQAVDVQLSADAEQDSRMETTDYAALIEELTQTAYELVAEAGRLQEAADELMAEEGAQSKQPTDSGTAPFA
jgi:hypothetical protein